MVRTALLSQANTPTLLTLLRRDDRSAVMDEITPGERCPKLLAQLVGGGEVSRVCHLAISLGWGGAGGGEPQSRGGVHTPCPLSLGHPGSEDLSAAFPDTCGKTHAAFY